MRWGIERKVTVWNTFLFRIDVRICPPEYPFHWSIGVVIKWDVSSTLP